MSLPENNTTQPDGLTSVQNYLALQRQARELPINHDISPTAANVYRIMASMANPHRDEGKFTCWPSMKYIADCIGQNRSTAIRATKELVEKGLLTREQRHDGKALLSSLYELTLDNKESDINSTRGRGMDAPTPRGMGAPTPGAPMHHKEIHRRGTEKGGTSPPLSNMSNAELADRGRRARDHHEANRREGRSTTKSEATLRAAILEWTRRKELQIKSGWETRLRSAQKAHSKAQSKATEYELWQTQTGYQNALRAITCPFQPRTQ